MIKWYLGPLDSWQPDPSWLCWPLVVNERGLFCLAGIRSTSTSMLVLMLVLLWSYDTNGSAMSLLCSYTAESNALLLLWYYYWLVIPPYYLQASRSPSPHIFQIISSQWMYLSFPLLKSCWNTCLPKYKFTSTFMHHPHHRRVGFVLQKSLESLPLALGTHPEFCTWSIVKIL